MAKIVIYNDRPRKPGDLLAALAAHENIQFSYTNEQIELELLLQKKQYDLAILLVNDVPSHELYQLVSKTKNVSHLRETRLVTIHALPSEKGIRTSLMLGSDEIYLEPIDYRQVVRYLYQISLGEASLPPGWKHLEAISSIPCRLSVFGRIGKIYKAPLGNLQIESNAILKPGQWIRIDHQLSKDTESVTEYRVLEKQTQDIYYKYENSYQLAFDDRDPQAAERQKNLTSEFLKKNASQFNLPKTKVLWVTPRAPSEINDFFEKKLFSLHTRTPGTINEYVLNKVNPRILIIDGEKRGPILDLIQNWSEQNQKHGNLIIQTTEAVHHESWKSIPWENPESFRAELLKAAKDLLRGRVEASLPNACYPSRDSAYSRAMIKSQAFITAATETYLKVLADFSIEIGTILEIQPEQLPRERLFGLYGKVVQTEQTADGKKYHLLCQVVPVTDSTNLSIPNIRDFLIEERSKGTGAAVDKNQNASSQPKKPNLFLALMVLLGIIALGGVVLHLLRDP